jgi:hypothetical protein
MQEFTGRIFYRSTGRGDGTVSSLLVIPDIRVRDQTPRIPERGRHLIAIDNWAELCQPRQWPASALVITTPATIKHKTGER